jgi:hypothetical protein
VELSRKTWPITSLSPGAGEKMSRHAVAGGDISALPERLSLRRRKARERTGFPWPAIVIQEAGLDGFWDHRVLEAEGGRRRVKTDRLDGETLIRALLAFKRREPRVCSMLHVPSPKEEDRLASVHRCGTQRKSVFDVAGYALFAAQRTDSGRAQASMRLRAVQPMATSACWAAKERARRRRPINPLYRPMAVSIRERFP